MATKFYFHAATSTVSGTLPSTEQSSLTFAANADALTVNRSMDTSIGTSQASLTIAATSSTRNLYYTRFVSPPIYGNISIAANTWTYAFSAMETSTLINFPVSGNNASVRITAYVWRPSTGAVVGTILDGTSAATVDESTANTQTYHIVSFTGAAVSGVQDGDVIIFEVWFVNTSTTTGSMVFYYDGTTEYTENATSTSAASYISTPETYAFNRNIIKSLTETVTISEPNTPKRTVVQLNPRDNTSFTYIAGNDTSTANTTANYALSGWVTKDTTETRKQIIYRTEGTFKNLFVRLGSNSVSAATTFTLRKNGTNANQTVSVASGATGIFEDSANIDVVGYGDKFNLQAIPGSGSTGTFQPAIISLLFNPDLTAYTVTRLVNSGGNFTQSTASATNYLPLIGTLDWVGTETSTQCIQEKAGTFRNMAVNISANTSTTAQTFTLRNNAASVTQTISVGAGVTGIFENLTNIDTVAVGDKVDVMFVSGLATVNITVSSLQIDFVAAVNTGITQMIAGRCTGAGFGISQTNYLYVGGVVGFAAGSNESWEQFKLRKGYNFSSLSCNVSTNTITAASTMTFRKNTTDGNQQISIPSSSTGFFTDSTHIDVASGLTDTVDIKLVTGGTGTTLTLVNVSVWAYALNVFVRSISDTPVITVSDSITRSVSRASTIQSLTENITISSSVTRLKSKSRSITENVTISSGTLNRLAAKWRTIGAESYTALSFTSLSYTTVGSGSETYNISDSVARKKGEVKALPTETVTVSAGTLNRLAQKIRSKTETTAIGEALNRLSTKIRTLATQTVLVSENVARPTSKNRALPTETVTVSSGILNRLAQKIRSRTETTTIGETLNRLSQKTRALATQTTAISDAVARLKIKNAVKSLTETTTISEVSLTRTTAKIRALATQTVTVGESVNRLAQKIRTLAAQTTTISDSIARTVTHGGVNITKTLTENITISAGTVNRLAQKIRSRTETTTISEVSVNRLSTKVRALATQTVVISDALGRIKGKVKSLPTETVTISSGTLNRLAQKIRSNIENITIGETLNRLAQKTRVLATQTTSISDAVARQVSSAGHIIRTLTETVIISETLNRLAKKTRSRTETTITISDSIIKSKGKTRTLAAETTTVSDAVNRKKTLIRALTIETTLIGDNLTRLAKKIRTLAAETTTISDAVARLKSHAQVNITKTLTENVTISAGAVNRLSVKVRTLATQIVIINELLRVYKNGVELVKPQSPGKGGQTTQYKKPVMPRAKFKQILYPVYSVEERNRLEVRRKLREYPPLVIIEAFEYNINKTVAPFIVNDPAKNRVYVRFAVADNNRTGNLLSLSSSRVSDTSDTKIKKQKIGIPIILISSDEKIKANKAICPFLMSEVGIHKAVHEDSKKITKLTKLMSLWFMAKKIRLF